MDKNAVVDLIIRTVDDYRLTMQGSSEAIGPETHLYGPAGVLDSLGLVSVLVEIEQKIADRGAGPVSLMNDAAVSRASSPFRTVDSLAEYLMPQLAGSEA